LALKSTARRACGCILFDLNGCGAQIGRGENALAARLVHRLPPAAATTRRSYPLVVVCETLQPKNRDAKGLVGNVEDPTIFVGADFSNLPAVMPLNALDQSPTYRPLPCLLQASLR
jgi:hypothetical protein